MSPFRINLGPLTLVAENLGWFTQIYGPQIRGYYGPHLEWTISFSPEELHKALNVWISFRLVESYTKEQATIAQTLASVVEDLQQTLEVQERRLAGNGATGEQLQRLREAIQYLKDYPQEFASQAKAPASSNPSVVAQGAPSQSPPPTPAAVEGYEQTEPTLAPQPQELIDDSQSSDASATDSDESGPDQELDRSAAPQ